MDEINNKTVGEDASRLPDSSGDTVKASRSCRPHFDRTRKNLIVCGILLVLFCFYGGMAMYFEGFSVSGIAILLAIAAATILLMHTELKLPFFVRLIVVLLLPACAFLLLETMTHNVFATMEADAVLLNLAFYYLLGCFLFLITGSTRTALTILLIFANIVGVANYYVILFRSSPILPWDLLSLGTAATVADNYSFDATYELAWLCGGAERKQIPRKYGGGAKQYDVIVQKTQVRRTSLRILGLCYCGNGQVLIPLFKMRLQV